nr:signal peptide peptidase SppA [Acidobacteriota bacterium]
MRDFLKMFFASLLALGFVAAGLLAAVLLVALLAAGSAGQSAAPRAPRDAMLVLDLSTPVTDRPPHREPGQLLRDAVLGQEANRLTLWDVTQAIRHAADDDGIRGILISGGVARDGYASGWAALSDVRRALLAFKQSKKPVWAYDMGYDEASYYLASVADQLLVHPYGDVEVNGLASEPMFFARAFEKYGVDVQVTRVGKYKSAVEPFVLDRMSDENREQIGLLLGDLWSVFLSDVGASRALPAAELQRLADDRGVYQAAEAKALRLVDRLAYYDELQEELKKVTGADADARTFRRIDLEDYILWRAARQRPAGAKNRIAVIYAEGEIVDGDDRSEVGGDALARLLRRARLDKNVKGVVLRVNSPGGSASASEVIQREVRLTREKKPVAISMGTVAASGGYWISTFGDRIFAEPNTITGSIGVFGMLPSVQRLMNNVGITTDVVKTGRHADLFTIFRPKTDEELAIVQGFVDRIYDEFTAKVAESRKLPLEKVLEIAQGRVWSGGSAKALGLVDELGGLSATIEWTAKKAGLGDAYGLTFYQEQKTPWQQLLASMGGHEERDRASGGPLLAEARRVAGEFERLGRLSDP